jgi:predicted acyltransferase
MMIFMSPTTATAPARVLSIDVLRGLTIALMILVNDPGDWSHTFAQLDHARWNGFTLTDLVFPNFLFIVGASIIFSLDARIRRSASGQLDRASGQLDRASGQLDLATRRTLALHILRRSAIIFALDLFFGLYPHFHYTHLRLFGVLTRIALCYLCAGLICLVTQRADRLLAICAVLLIGYWALMRFVPVPGCGIPTHEIPILDPNCNLAAWLDRYIIVFTQNFLHTGRLYEHTRDPEGLLSTLPAIATTLLGSVTALWLRRVTIPAAKRNFDTPKDAPFRDDTSINSSSRPEAAQFAAAAEGPREAQLTQTARTFSTQNLTPARLLKGLLLAGILSLAVGSLWNLSFPINKNLWTSSYVLFSAGWALLLLAAFYWLIDIRHFNETKAGKWLTFPWLVFGSNAIVAFCVSDFIVVNMIWLKLPFEIGANGQPVTAWFWIYHHIFAFNGSTKITSLAFALAFVAICFIPNWLLWRKRIFIKI